MKNSLNYDLTDLPNGDDGTNQGAGNGWEVKKLGGVCDLFPPRKTKLKYPLRMTKNHF